jgi:hypothetical protein
VVRSREWRDGAQKDLFRAKFDQIVDMSRALAKLAAITDWAFLQESLGAV